MCAANDDGIQGKRKKPNERTGMKKRKIKNTDIDTYSNSNGRRVG